MDKKARKALIELFDEIYHALENAGADDEALESVEVSITDLEKAMG